MPAARRICRVKALASALTKSRRRKLPQATVRSSAAKAQSTIRCLRLSISCPHLGTLLEPKTALSFRQYSSATGPLKRCDSLQQIFHSANQEVSKRAYGSCNAGCPCPFPCGPCGCKGGCGCLPPPCNTPPKCLQYMTGYFYYPYGTWFCGPYHVTGTCQPAGAGCPCPCPAKCCPACVCAPAQSMASNKNVSDINQFPMEVPCPMMPKVPQEARGGFSKVFNFNPPDASSQQKTKPTGPPPVFRTLLCLSLRERTTSMDNDPRIQSSYPIAESPKSRFYHTKTNLKSADTTSTAPMQSKHTLKCFYQSRRKVATPMERTRIFLKENKNSRRAKLDSENNPKRKRRDPRPDVDIEIHPYNDRRLN